MIDLGGGSGLSPRTGRALIVAYCFPPHAAIGTHRTLRLVSHLVDRGWHVDVLTVAEDTYLNGTPVDERLHERVPPSVRVIRSGAFRGFSKAGRFINRVRPTRVAGDAPAAHVSTAVHTSPRHRGALESMKLLAEELAALPDKEVGWLLPAVARGLRAFSGTPPHVIFSSAPPWTTHLAAGLLAYAFRCRWVADFRDPWVRSPWTRYRTGPGKAIATRLEERVVRGADAVLFTTESARREFADHYGPELSDRFSVVFNGCDPEEFKLTRAVRDEEHFTVLHAGTLYGGRSPVPLIHALGRLIANDPSAASRLRVRFLGATGFPGVDIFGLCAQQGLSEVVEFAPRVDRQESLNQMRRASALLILQAGTAMAIPGKLYEYLAAGRPIFALCEEGEMADFIRVNRLGIAVGPTDEAEIERGLRELLDAPLDSWARPHASLFDGRLRAAEMGAILESLLPVPTRQHPDTAAATGRGRV